LENVLEGKTNVFIGCVKPTEKIKDITRYPACMQMKGGSTPPLYTYPD